MSFLVKGGGIGHSTSTTPPSAFVDLVLARDVSIEALRVFGV